MRGTHGVWCRRRSTGSRLVKESMGTPRGSLPPVSLGQGDPNRATTPGPGTCVGQAWG